MVQDVSFVQLTFHDQFCGLLVTFVVFKSCEPIETLGHLSQSLDRLHLKRVLGAAKLQVLVISRLEHSPCSDIASIALIELPKLLNYLRFFNLFLIVPLYKKTIFVGFVLLPLC